MQQIDGKDPKIKRLKDKLDRFILLDENDFCELWLKVGDTPNLHEYHIEEKTFYQDYWGEWSEGSTIHIWATRCMVDAEHNYETYTRYIEHSNAAFNSKDENLSAAISVEAEEIAKQLRFN